MKHDFSCWEKCKLDFPPVSRKKTPTPLRHCQMNCLQSYQHYSVAGDESIFRSTLFTKPSRLNTLYWILVRFWTHCNYFNRTDDGHLKLLTLSTHTPTCRQQGFLFTKTAHPIKADKLFIYLPAAVFSRCSRMFPYGFSNFNVHYWDSQIFLTGFFCFLQLLWTDFGLPLLGGYRALWATLAVRLHHQSCHSKKPPFPRHWDRLWV